jgi:N-acetylmuramoyl-L-alanine amidase
VGLVCAGLGFGLGFGLSSAQALGWAPPNRAKPRRPAVLSAWERAVRARAEFQAQPAGTHTRTGYTRVMDGFRAVYHDAPRDEHAADAVCAVAELLAEQGHELEDTISLRKAVGQYEFLRQQYPGSPLRMEALLDEARIEEQDLNDRDTAREKYGAVIREAPRSKAAVEARVALRQLGHAPVGAPVAAEDDARNEQPHPAASVPAIKAATGGAEKVVASDPMPELAGKRSASRRPVAMVTGIRHWSTATYTRVVIDLGDEVTFEAARVPNPDRICFDLHGAKLGAELVGKTFTVTDDGFLKKIRAAQQMPDVTRVVLDVNDVSEYSAFLLPNPSRLIIDVHGGSRTLGRPSQAAAPAGIPQLAPEDTARASAAANVSGLPAMAPTGRHDSLQSEPVGSGAKPVPNTVAVKAAATGGEVAAVSAVPGKVNATTAPTSRPIAETVPVPSDTALPGVSGRRRGSTIVDAPVKAAARTQDGDTSLIRALGLRVNRIVIDAGHGGKDSGTLGARGIQEKDVVLDVALRLGRLLHDRLGAEVIYTRSDDTFIPLETRTAIANKAQADLFLSIHANSSQDDSARGVETYYLNFTSDPSAVDVAARENAVSGQSVHQLSDLVKKIALKDKIAESREFAADVENSLYAGLRKGNDGLRDRGVKKAPFVVLIGANMPSILTEISFVTNERDANELRQPEYRQRLAESLYAGVAQYEAGLAGPRPSPTVVRASMK